MRKLLYVILLLLFRLLMFPGAVCAEILSLPDSLITDDNVYKYTFSDFDKAQQVMEQSGNLFPCSGWMWWKVIYISMSANIIRR